MQGSLKTNQKNIVGATHHSVVDEVLDAAFKVLSVNRGSGELPVGNTAKLKRSVHVEEMRLNRVRI